MNDVNYIVNEVAEKLAEYLYRRRHEIGWRHGNIKLSLNEQAKRVLFNNSNCKYKRRVLSSLNIPKSLQYFPELRRSIKNCADISPTENQCYSMNQREKYMVTSYDNLLDNVVSTLRNKKQPLSFYAETEAVNSGQHGFGRAIKNKRQSQYQKRKLGFEIRKKDRLIASTSMVLCNALIKLNIVSQCNEKEQISTPNPTKLSTKCSQLENKIDSYFCNKTVSSSEGSDESCSENEDLCFVKKIVSKSRQPNLKNDAPVNRQRNLQSVSSLGSSVCDVQLAKRFVVNNALKNEKTDSKKLSQTSTISKCGDIKCIDRFEVLSAIDSEMATLAYYKKKQNKFKKVQTDNLKLSGTDQFLHGSSGKYKKCRISKELLENRPLFHPVASLSPLKENSKNVRKHGQLQPPITENPLSAGSVPSTHLKDIYSKTRHWESRKSVPEVGSRVLVLWPIRMKLSVPVSERLTTIEKSSHRRLILPPTPPFPKCVNELPVYRSPSLLRTATTSTSGMQLIKKTIFTSLDDKQTDSQSKINANIWPHLCMHIRQKTYQISVLSSRVEPQLKPYSSDAVPPISLVVSCLEGKSQSLSLPLSLNNSLLHELHRRSSFSVDCIHVASKPKSLLADTPARQHNESDLIHLDSFSFTCENLGPISSIEVSPSDAALLPLEEDWLIESIHINESGASMWYKFECNQWLNFNLKRFLPVRKTTDSISSQALLQVSIRTDYGISAISPASKEAICFEKISSAAVSEGPIWSLEFLDKNRLPNWDAQYAKVSSLIVHPMHRQFFRFVHELGTQLVINTRDLASDCRFACLTACQTDSASHSAYTTQRETLHSVIQKDLQWMIIKESIELHRELQVLPTFLFFEFNETFLSHLNQDYPVFSYANVVIENEQYMNV